MSGLEPTGPSQPPLNDVYKTAGNPAEKEPAEQAAATDRTNASDAPIAYTSTIVPIPQFIS